MRKNIIPEDVIEERIYLIRGKRVMLDSDLAEPYGVSVKRLNEQVKRNAARFPRDFMFVLTSEEGAALRSRFATLETKDDSADRRGRHSKYQAHVFTEQGVAMLSGVLYSSRAIKVNIAIMRAFINLRKMIASHGDLSRRLDNLEKKYDIQFRAVFDAIRKILKAEEKPGKKIGF